MTAPHAPLNVLFLCNYNSARSILAEALLNDMGVGRFKAYSAGSSPRTEVHPMALQVLQHAGVSTEGLRSKGWQEFSAPGEPHMDLVITLCDDTAGEACPAWPGHPATAHWGYADPVSSKVDDAHRLEAFRQTLHLLRHRLELLLLMPPEKLDRALLQNSARELAAH